METERIYNGKEGYYEVLMGALSFPLGFGRI